MRESANFRATKLQQVLADQGLKARSLAATVNISESHMSRIVSGERRVPESLARQIAEAVGIPLFLIFELTSVSKLVTEEVAA